MRDFILGIVALTFCVWWINSDSLELYQRNAESDNLAVAQCSINWDIRDFENADAYHVSVEHCTEGTQRKWRIRNAEQVSRESLSYYNNK